jgi:hypothetical protein
MSRKRIAALASFVLLAAIAAAVILALRVADRPESGTPAHVPATWAEVRTRPGHTMHVGKPDVACHDCHEETDASFTSKGVAACTHCHEKQTSKTHAGGGEEKTSCLSCHAFGAKPAAACISCHAKPEGKHQSIRVHASPDADCKSCHDPHRDPIAINKDCPQPSQRHCARPATRARPRSSGRPATLRASHATRSTIS